MDAIEIIEAYEVRSKTARMYREIAALILVISIILLALDGIYRTKIGIWEGILLAAGIILLVLAFASAMLSLIKLQCPNCSRIIGEVFDPAYCPSCGAALKPGSPIGMVSPAGQGMQTRGLARGVPGKAAGEKAMARRAALGKWTPKAELTVPEDYPDEGYPKNIRLFTTSDEMELTKRFIKLIDRDDGHDSLQQEGGLAHKAAGKKVKDARKPVVEQSAGKSESGAFRRRGDRKSPEEESLENIGALARILLKIRRL